MEKMKILVNKKPNTATQFLVPLSNQPYGEPTNIMEGVVLGEQGGGGSGDCCFDPDMDVTFGGEVNINNIFNVTEENITINNTTTDFNETTVNFNESTINLTNTTIDFTDATLVNLPVWRLDGNDDVTGEQFLGPNNTADLVFKIGGYQVGRIKPLPDYGVYFGHDVATYAEPTVSFNIGLGYRALYSVVGGNSLIAIGESSLYSCENCNADVSIGNGSMKFFNGIGTLPNVSLGTGSMFNLVNGSANTSVGAYSMTNISENGLAIDVSRVVSVGYKSLAGFGDTMTKTVSVGAHAAENVGNAVEATVVGSYAATKKTLEDVIVNNWPEVLPTGWIALAPDYNDDNKRWFESDGTATEPFQVPLNFILEQDGIYTVRLTILEYTGGTAVALQLGNLTPISIVASTVGVYEESYVASGGEPLFSISTLGNFTGVISVEILTDKLENLGSVTYVGYDVRAAKENEINSIAIGYQTQSNGDNTVTLGNDQIEKTFIKGETNMPSYGDGTYMGTPMYILGVDENGKVVEVTDPTVPTGAPYRKYTATLSILPDGTIVPDVINNTFGTFPTWTLNATNGTYVATPPVALLPDGFDPDLTIITFTVPDAEGEPATSYAYVNADGKVEISHQKLAIETGVLTNVPFWSTTGKYTVTIQAWFV